MAPLLGITGYNPAETTQRVAKRYPVQETKFNPEQFVVTETGQNMFSGKYYGVNEKLGVGSEISYQKQAGVDRSGRTLGFY